jgi:hypothetical protein
MRENTRDVLDHIANNSRFIVRRDNYERIAEYLPKISHRNRAQIGHSTDQMRRFTSTSGGSLPNALI